MPDSNTKPVFKRVSGAWVKQTAYERVNGAWVKISSAEEAANGYTITYSGYVDSVTANGVTLTSGATVEEGTQISVSFGVYNTFAQEYELFINGVSVATSSTGTGTYTTTVTANLDITCDAI